MQASIVILVLVIIIVAVVIYFLTKGNTPLSSLSQGTSMQTIQSSALSNPQAANFTFSMWFYINGLNYNYNRHKVLMARLTPTNMGNATSATGSCPGYSTMKQSSPCPLIVIVPYTNDLEISLTVNNGTDATPTVDNTLLTNVPIQKWVNLLMSVYGRTLDIYLDGKLAKTTVLPGTAIVSANENLYITPCGGFDGWTSKVQYFPNATNPQQAWTIYKAGYGGGFFSNMFDKPN